MVGHQQPCFHKDGGVLTSSSSTFPTNIIGLQHQSSQSSTSGICSSFINAGAAALLSSQLRKRKGSISTLSVSSASKCSAVESKKSKLDTTSSGSSNCDDNQSSQPVVISPIQFLEGLFSSISGGIETIRIIQNEHKDKLASNCTSSPPQCDIDSYSVQIVRAVQTGDISTLKTILLKQHQQDSATAANIFNACNRFGESLLHMACRRGHFEIVQFLIKDAGVTIDRYDDYGRTPLHDAFWTSKPNFTIVDLLVRNCSPHLLLSYDIRGHTPFHYARSEHHTVWTTFLRQHRSILMQRISLYLSTVSMKFARQKAVTEGKPLETKVKVEEEIQEEHISCNTSSGDKCVSEIDSSTTNQVEKLSSSSTTQADCSFVKEIVVPIPSHSVLFPSQQQTQQMLSNSSQAVVDEQILKPSNDMFLQQQQPFGSILQSPNFPSGTVQLLPLHLPQQQLELQKQQSPMSMPLMSNNLGFNNVQCSNLPLQLFPLYHHQQQGITNQSLANFQNLLLTHNILQQQQQQQLLNMSTMTPILVSNAANPALPLSQTIFIPHNQQHPVQSILTVNNSHTPAQQQSSNHSTQEEQIKS